MIDTQAALAHFKQTDPVITEALEQLLANNPGYETPQKLPSELYFERICRSVVSQQLSVKAASTIWGRCKELLMGKDASGALEPHLVLQHDIPALRAVGLSNQKAKYLLHIAQEVDSGQVALDHLDELENEEVIAELIKLYGIGRWSAEMFLVFSLARPDVFSYGDLGLKMGFIELYGHPPTETVVDAWSPHRTMAALTLWHHKDNRPDA